MNYSSAPRFCPRCGQPITPHAAFCGACGLSIQPGQPAQALSSAQPSPQPITSPVASSRHASFAAFFTQHRKLLIPLLAGFSIIILGIILVQAFRSEPIAGTRTMMIYMIGSNLESDGAAATADLDEIIHSGYDSTATRIFIYTGGARQWHRQDISADENAVYEIQNRELVKLQTYDQSPMIQPANLTTFVDYVTSYSQTDLYDLVLWDHGGGPIVGYGADETSLRQSPMSLPDLQTALADTAFIRQGQHLDFIGFDACLMGSIEIAKALQPYGHYLIASEEVEPGYGWDYSYLANVAAQTTTPQLAASLIDSYSDFYESQYRYDVDYSLSAIDLTQLDRVISAADAFFSRLNAEISAATFSNYSRSLTRNIVYGAASRDGDSFDLVDLQALTSSISNQYASESTAVSSAIQDAVIYSRTNIPDTNGLSIYFPTKNKQYLIQILKDYASVSYSSEYYDFLTRYAGFINDEQLAVSTTSRNFTSQTDASGITITIPEDLAANYQSAKFNIFRKLGDNRYMPVYQSTDVQRNDTQLLIGSGSTQLQFAAMDRAGNAHYLAALEVTRTSEYADYYTPTISEIPDSSNSVGYSSRSLNVYFRIKKGETTAEILDVKDVTKPSDADDTVTQLAPKATLNFNEITSLRFFNGSYKVYDDYGNLLEGGVETWNSPILSVFYPVTDFSHIELKDLAFDYGPIEVGGSEPFTIPNDASKDFYCQAIIYDTQGAPHRMDLVHINN